MIKAFLFDYGGVISRGGKGDGVSQRLATNLSISHEAAKDALWAGWGGWLRGKSTEAELWQDVEAKLGRPVTAEQRDIWNSWELMKQIPEMLTLLSDLRSAGHRVGLISNVMPDTAQLIRQHGGYAGFDFTILSCEVGYIKPEPEIYQLALAHLPGLQTSEMVFLDDQERCLVPARELGMATILVEDNAQTVAAVRALL